MSLLFALAAVAGVAAGVQADVRISALRMPAVLRELRVSRAALATAYYFASAAGTSMTAAMPNPPPP